MRKWMSWIGLLAVLFVGLPACFGTSYMDLTNIVNDATTVFDMVKVVAVSIVAFFLILWVVKKIRGSR